MNRYFPLILAAAASGFFAKATAQTTPLPTPAAQDSPTRTATPFPTATDTAVTASGTQGSNESENAEEEDQGEKEKPFVPHWTGQLGFNYSTQPSQLGQGQQTQELSFTGTYDLTESGHYFSWGITGGEQLLEGALTNYGEITAEGGLGLGIFLPSLSLALQQGAAALNSYSSTLTLNFQVLDSLTAGTTGGVGLESHQGPASQIYPNASNPDSFIEVDTGNWTAGVEVSFTPWDFETLTLTAEQETDLTFQTQGINHNNVNAINQSDQIPSLTLETETTFVKDFQLLLSGQIGEEYYSAGTVFSPITGKTRTFTQATAESFTGFTVGMLYNFQ
jgi:hypothetical protein